MGILGKFFSVAAVVLSVAVFFGIYLLSPQYSGQIQHTRQYGEVKILRDSHGVPHITGKDLPAVQYGLGYAHCQDRLWNMDIFRRIPSGRMSELLGNATVETDKMLREFGLGRAGRAMLEYLSKDAEANLQAYADGINDCAESLPILPLEYQITRTTFAKWEIVDSLYFEKLLNFNLSMDWPFEVMRQKLLEVYGKVLAAEMLGNSRLFDDTTIMSDEELKQMNLYEKFENKTTEEKGENVSALALDLVMKSGLIDMLTQGRGSNGWVISGNHTTTGKPIVANDPHLDNYMPSIWSQAVLQFKNSKGKDNIVSGGSMPGTGFIFSGMTNYFAWSVTTLYTDISDLYAETLNKEGTHYLLDGEYQPLKTITEDIIVKGQDKPIAFEIKYTHRGPVLLKEGLNVSLVWPGAISQDRSVNSLFGFYHIDTLQEMLDCLYDIDGPPQAITFATTDNHIGFFGNGRHPIRNTPFSGTFIQNGTTRANDWVRFNTREEQPRLVDPPKGFIVTGNNKFASDNVVGHLSASSATTARGLRITQMIEAYIKNGTKISPEDVMNMQRDVLDSFAVKLHPSMMKLYETEKNNVLSGEELLKCDEMMKILNNWDFRAERDSVGATIYYAIDMLLSKVLLPQYSETLSERQKITNHFFFDHFKFNQIQDWANGIHENEAWCLNPLSTLPSRHCIFDFIDSVNRARLYLIGKLGEDMTTWSYGRLHRHSYVHIPFSKTPLKKLYERSYSAKGSRFTVHVSKKDFQNDSWESMYGGNIKVINSLDQVNSTSYYILDTGVSGSALSAHYDDQMEIYKEGGYLVTYRNISQIPNPAVLVLSNKKQLKKDL